MEDEDFQKAATFQAQCHIANRVCRSHYLGRGRHWVHQISLNEIVQFFNVNAARIEKPGRSPLEEHQPGRPPMLSNEIKQ
jgi:hypothetical protein